jgi:hypothetical protein
MPGERVTLSATGIQGVPASAYTWSASAGRIIGTGSQVQFDSAGLVPGTYIIKLSARDAAGRESGGTIFIDVEVPPPPPPSPIKQIPLPHPVAAKPTTAAHPPVTASQKSSGASSASQNPQSQKQVSTGNVAFKSEDTMKLGNSYPVLVVVSQTVSQPELTQILEEKLKKARPDTQKSDADQGKMTSEEIKFTPKMRAHLSANSDEFAITPPPSEEQDTTVEPVTTWEWIVKPLKAGKDMKLDLTLSIVVDSQGTSHTINTYHRFILVKVSFAHRAKDFVAANWQWLWAALFVPLAGWLWRRRRQQSGPPDKP